MALFHLWYIGLPYLYRLKFQNKTICNSNNIYLIFILWKRSSLIHEVAKWPDKKSGLSLRRTVRTSSKSSFSYNSCLWFNDIYVINNHFFLSVWYSARENSKVNNSLTDIISRKHNTFFKHFQFSSSILLYFLASSYNLRSFPEALMIKIPKSICAYICKSTKCKILSFNCCQLDKFMSYLMTQMNS